MSKETKTSKTKTRRALAGVVAAVVAVVAVLAGAAFGGGEPEDVSDNHVVSRGSLRISVEGEATLDPIREFVTDNDYRYTTKVIFARTEGVEVKKGDIVVELDSADVADRLEKQKLDVTHSQSLLDQARETLAIEESEAEGRIQSARLDAEFAATNLLQYVDGTWPQQKRNFEMNVQQAEEELLLAREQLDWAVKLEEKGFETRKALAEQRLKVTQLGAALTRAREKLRIAATYDYPRLRRKFESAKRQAELECERETARTAARLAKYRGNLKTREYVHDNEMDRLKFYQDQIEAAKIRAKADGMVVFPMNRYSSNQGVIEEGTTVYYGQSLLAIPDTSRMKVAFMVHESDIHRLSLGQTARVALDSYNGETFTARLSKIAHTPDGMAQYYRPGMKLYKTEAVIEDELPEDVKPGMSGSVIIEIARLEDVLTVPLSAVTSVNGERVCVVKKDGREELRAVTTGLYNDRQIQILSGLSVGEVVSLSPPVGEGAVEQDFADPLRPTAHFEEEEFTRRRDDGDTEAEPLLRTGG